MALLLAVFLSTAAAAAVYLKCFEHVNTASNTSPGEKTKKTLYKRLEKNRTESLKFFALCVCSELRTIASAL